MAGTTPPAIVLDNGSGYIKTGYGGANFPACVIPTVLGRPAAAASSSSSGSLGINFTSQRKQVSRAAVGSGGSDGSTEEMKPLPLKDLYRGEEALRLSDRLDLSRPITNGVLHSSNVDDVQALWEHAWIDSMGLSVTGESQKGSAGALADRSLLLSEGPFFLPAQRARVFEVLLESYGFARIQTALQGVLAIFSSGLETGVAVECGDSLLHCTPVFEGYALTKANRRVNMGGRDVSRHLARLLQRRGFPLGQGESSLELARRLKEQFCYTAVDMPLELQLARETTAAEQSVLLPDGRVCTLGEERFAAAEAMFHPGLAGVEGPGLSEQLWECVQAADMDVRAALYGHIVLSGGSSMFPGLPTRLQRDMTQFFLARNLKGVRSRLRTTRCPIRVEDPPRRKHMVFLGGAALAEVTAHTPDMWLTKGEWAEGGESALRARFGTGD